MPASARACPAHRFECDASIEKPSDERRVSEARDPVRADPGVPEKPGRIGEVERRRYVADEDRAPVEVKMHDRTKSNLRAR